MLFKILRNAILTNMIISCSCLVSAADLFCKKEFHPSEFHQDQGVINKIVASEAQNVYAQINKNWSYPKNNAEYSTQSIYWKSKEITANNATSHGKIGSVRMTTLTLNCQPEKIVEALKDLINKPAVSDCTIALHTVNLMCLMKLLGEENFTAYVKTIYEGLEKGLHGFSTDDFFLNLPRQFLSFCTKAEPIEGSVVYLTNQFLYNDYKTGKGYHQGDNLFCVGKDRYCGFGAFYIDGSKTSAQIKQQAFKDFCDPSDVAPGCKLEHKTMCDMFREDISFFNTSIDRSQKKHYDFFRYFDYNKLVQYQIEHRCTFQA